MKFNNEKWLLMFWLSAFKSWLFNNIMKAIRMLPLRHFKLTTPIIHHHHHYKPKLIWCDCSRSRLQIFLKHKRKRKYFYMCRKKSVFALFCFASIQPADLNFFFVLHRLIFCVRKMHLLSRVYAMCDRRRRCNIERNVAWGNIERWQIVVIRDAEEIRNVHRHNLKFLLPI